MKIAIMLLAIALSSTTVFAESTCIKCRQDSMLEWKKCMGSAKSQDEMLGCKKQGEELKASCEKICFPPVSEQEKIDWSIVIDFVKKNNDVINEVGSFKYAVSAASFKAPGETMPSIYMVNILDGKKPAYPIVKVSRSTGKTKPALDCISHVSPKELRVPLNDICKQ